jgi:hypothetical protein
MRVHFKLVLAVVKRKLSRETNDCTLKFRLTATLLDQLESLAVEENAPVSGLVREAIAQLILERKSKRLVLAETPRVPVTREVQDAVPTTDYAAALAAYFDPALADEDPF